MGDGCGGREGDRCERGLRVAVRGVVARRPRGIRTVEGWEVASVVLGADTAHRPHGSAVLVVCAGTGAAAVMTRLPVGEEVIVLGRLVVRRAARPEDDAMELAADAVLARRGARPTRATSRLHAGGA